ncbi:Na/Pi cotransporter family protein [Rhodobacteraceae bacterium NNCM2]|nr:Na/Pi cotransporter family protein [Coraliihabitans acroporae]
MANLLLFEVAVSVLSAVILFVYALKGFSNDVQKVGGKALADWLGRLTRNRFFGFALGAGLTALVQSSSAISGIAVAMVEAGTITFRGSLPVFLGANVGTTSTAWLVTIDATLIGPFLIILSAATSMVPGRVSLIGRSILYLGIIMLALQLISEAVAPLKTSPDAAEWMAYAKHPAIGLIIGILATAFLQSSSVVVGLAIIAVQQGFLETADVIPIVFGCNIGTTSTALVAAMSMGAVARRSAIANLVFNMTGVILFLPFTTAFAGAVVQLVGQEDIAVATAHLLFNLGVAVAGFVLMTPLARILEPEK